jgi:hypothetical protein
VAPLTAFDLGHPATHNLVALPNPMPISASVPISLCAPPCHPHKPYLVRCPSCGCPADAEQAERRAKFLGRGNRVGSPGFRVAAAPWPQQGSNSKPLLQAKKSLSARKRKTPRKSVSYFSDFWKLLFANRLLLGPQAPYFQYIIYMRVPC